jgi:hypothetical protein
VGRGNGWSNRAWDTSIQLLLPQATQAIQQDYWLGLYMAVNSSASRKSVLVHEWQYATADHTSKPFNGLGKTGLVSQSVRSVALLGRSMGGFTGIQLWNMAAHGQNVRG